MGSGKQEVSEASSKTVLGSGLTRVGTGERLGEVPFPPQQLWDGGEGQGLGGSRGSRQKSLFLWERGECPSGC